MLGAMSSTSTPSGFAPLPAARVAAALNDDWQRLAASARAVTHARRWPELTGATGRSLGHVLAACGGDRTVPASVADENLARLVAVAAHDELAARVVLQRLVPGLVSAARRHRHLGMQTAFDELVGAAWVLVRTYRLDRRPRRIASNLCRDAAYEAFVRSRRLRSAAEELRGGLREELPSLTPGYRPNGRRLTPAVTVGVMRSALPGPDDEVHRLLVDAGRAGVSPARLELLVELHVLGHHPRVLAERMRVSERTVRDRRDATLRQIARLEQVA